MAPRSICFPASLTSLLLGGTALAQSDLPVATVRGKAAVPGVAAEADNRVHLSEIPRYYLDTIDNLNRQTSDVTRGAPGLAKNNYVAAVYEVRHSEAIEIQSYLLRILAYEGGIAEVMGADTVVGADGKRLQYLFVAAPDFMLPGIDQLVAAADRPGFRFHDGTGKDFGGGPGCVRYVARHRTASELVAILRATELGNVGNFLFPPFADDSTNAIYVVDNPTDIADDIAALELFDRPPLQVEIRCAFYEVDVSDDGSLGLDFDAWKRGLSGAFALSVASTSGPLDSNGNLYTTLLALDARVLADFLNYTVARGNARLLTAGRLTMVNSEDLPGAVSGGARGTATGNPAVLEAITPLAFTTVQDDVGPTNAPNARNERVAELFEGVRLVVLPFIGTESITLQVEAQVNSVVGISPGTGQPLVAERRVNSVLSTRDGIPVAIAGLDRTTTVEERVGIPLLMDIPFIGGLFAVDSTEHRKTQIVIVLEPRLKDGSTPEPLPAAASSIWTPNDAAAR